MSSILIVGLGNPGQEYQDTRHNVGFMLLDSIAAVRPDSSLLESAEPGTHPVFFKHKGKSLIAEFRNVASGLCLMKPMTFMNLSGEAVSEYSSFYKIAADRIIVVHDEVDIPLGSIKLKKGGGDAGHNGLKSITSCLGTNVYFRIRVGVGRPPIQGEQNVPGISNWVLGRFTNSEAAFLDNIKKRVISALNCLLAGNLSNKALLNAQKSLVQA